MSKAQLLGRVSAHGSHAFFYERPSKCRKWAFLRFFACGAPKKIVKRFELALLQTLALLASTLKISARNSQNSPRYRRSKLGRNGQKWAKIGVFWPFFRFLPKSFTFKKIITRKVAIRFFSKWLISIVKGLNLILTKN